MFWVFFRFSFGFSFVFCFGLLFGFCSGFSLGFLFGFALSTITPPLIGALSFQNFAPSLKYPNSRKSPTDGPPNILVSSGGIGVVVKVCVVKGIVVNVRM